MLRRERDEHITEILLSPQEQPLVYPLFEVCQNAKSVLLRADQETQSVPVLVVVARREKTDKLWTEVPPVTRTKQIQQQPTTILMVTQLLKRVTDLLGERR